MNNKEKIMGFSYVTILFLIAVSICYCLLFWGNTAVVPGRKSYDLEKIKRIKDFQDIQSQEMALIDSLYLRINQYDPELHADYDDAEINFLLGSIRDVYSANGWDSRYKLFSYIANFYEMWWSDKKELWSKKRNISSFSICLEECEIGIIRNEKLRSGTAK